MADSPSVGDYILFTHGNGKHDNPYCSTSMNADMITVLKYCGQNSRYRKANDFKLGHLFPVEGGDAILKFSQLNVLYRINVLRTHCTL